MEQPKLRKDGKAVRRPLLGLLPGQPMPTVSAKADATMIPSPSLRSLVRVRRVQLRSGSWGWQSYCTASRCKYTETYVTHNGAQAAAKRHRVAKQYTKLHGATERQAS